MELEFVRDHGAERGIRTARARALQWLNGESGPIHEDNEAESLKLTESTAAEYIMLLLLLPSADGAPSF